MSHHYTSLRYSARREVLAHVAPRYQQATDAQKTPLLDQIVELTGYERTYAIRLLNHDPKGAARILRSRQPIYGSVVQEALFLAWRTLQYPCAKRLVPFLPKLTSVLERDGHIRLDEEHRHQLLAISVRTADRLLSTILLSYCQQEQLTFTRSRPACSNDNCHVEQKNGAVVRKIVGYDRLISLLAYQQLGELYQASRLLANAFQP